MKKNELAEQSCPKVAQFSILVHELPSFAFPLQVDHNNCNEQKISNLFLP